MKTPALLLALCPNHWKELRTALRVRGLEGFVSKSRAEAHSKAVLAQELGDAAAAECYDPLLIGATELLSNGLEVLSEDERGAIAAVKPDVPVCPLCYLLDTCSCGGGADCNFRLWIRYAAEEQLRAAIDLGLVPDVIGACPTCKAPVPHLQPEGGDCPDPWHHGRDAIDVAKPSVEAPSNVDN